MLYFAYGSNMSLARIQVRVPSARRVGPAVLKGHRLAFHKIGRDGSAKCDIAQTGRTEEQVNGVLYRMDPSHRPDLDRAEGLGRGYEIKTVELLTASRSAVSAFAYYATHVDPALKPFDWYLHHVLLGARENGLPERYIEQIAQIEATADPDRTRARTELAIHHHKGLRL